jgi:SAM-dependent methyltransferase
MGHQRQIIGSALEAPCWWNSPAGRRVVEWEQRCADEALVDAFGFHALQLGMPALDALRTNRISHQWLGVPSSELQSSPGSCGVGVAADATPRAARGPMGLLRCDFDALPFPGRSLDVVVLAHALEQSRDPHLALAEVERVLVPEGRLLIFGLNPASLWGLQPPWGQEACQPIAYRRLRDWLRLLSFEVERARFGWFRPPLARAEWLDRLEWMERMGARWWPVFGAVYAIEAVRRVRGMRLVGLARRQARYANAPRTAVTARHGRP